MGGSTRWLAVRRIALMADVCRVPKNKRLAGLMLNKSVMEGGSEATGSGALLGPKTRVEDRAGAGAPSTMLASLNRAFRA